MNERRVTIYESRLWWGLGVCTAGGFLVGVGLTLYLLWVWT